MTITEILNKTEHRPWSMPRESWRYYQEWNNAIFLHWKVDFAELRKLVPGDLEIDLFEGKPWVSVVAFSMEKVRIKNLPSFKPVSDFCEVNIRTYVRSNNKAGVYFLSIEGGKRLSCSIAKGISQLPYRFSKMSHTEEQYISMNAHFGETFEIQFKTGKNLAEKSTLDIWLTERYALFQDTANLINEYEIHHVEWPLKEMNVENLNIGYPRFSKLINNSPDKIHYSNGVQVIAWQKTIIDY